ncbi:hypothetical protein MAPG_00320 [Magnaporthiopsis poae ATCC 64411]|uniref:Uncharacterized protein n=1 Tax=Magnaporthiopsis poae (strain ATCC 64411 / 73-15) TaxID=644358 RepID=A0A0C4DKP2_MAGP6|nr:hypothetical protein MAPG_00320 [Magnaporthiopsis poae ATCC 64411]
MSYGPSCRKTKTVPSAMDPLSIKRGVFFGDSPAVFPPFSSRSSFLLFFFSLLLLLRRPVGRPQVSDNARRRSNGSTCPFRPVCTSPTRITTTSRSITRRQRRKSRPRRLTEGAPWLRLLPLYLRQAQICLFPPSHKTLPLSTEGGPAFPRRWAVPLRRRRRIHFPFGRERPSSVPRWVKLYAVVFHRLSSTHASPTTGRTGLASTPVAEVR